VGDCLRGKGLALDLVAWSHQSTRGLGGGRATKGIVSVDDRPGVNAAARIAGLLDQRLCQPRCRDCPFAW
jgi:hypothetical protein